MFNLSSSYSDSDYLSIEQVSLVINNKPVYYGGILHVTMLAHVICNAIDIEAYTLSDIEYLRRIARTQLSYPWGSHCCVLTINNEALYISNTR